MEATQTYLTTYRLDGQTHEAKTQIHRQATNGDTRYQAIIKDSPLRGTFSAWASSVAEALDFLNLAMQAEGADAIHFSESHGAR